MTYPLDRMPADMRGLKDGNPCECAGCTSLTRAASAAVEGVDTIVAGLRCDPGFAGLSEDSLTFSATMHLVRFATAAAFAQGARNQDVIHALSEGMVDGSRLALKARAAR